jgi:hypothetical protein
MRKGSRREKVMEAARTRLEAGIRPTFRDLGDATGMSAVGAWKHVQKLIGEGRLRVGPEGIELPDLKDLRSIATDRLRGELARRGVTLDALEEPKPLWNSGRSCAANHCMERVRRGQLMCRRHWFQLPRDLRSAIMDSWSARHMQAYQEAVEAARDHLGGFTRVVERVE